MPQITDRVIGFGEDPFLDTLNNVAGSFYDDLYEEYGIGGWLKKNAGTIGGVAGGILGSVVPGIGTAAGAALGSGFGSLLGGLGPEQEEEYISPEYMGERQGVGATTNIRPMKKGGLIRGGFRNPNNMLIEYDGPLHDSGFGGIRIGDDLMVEGGESRTGDVVHSDNVEISKDIVRKFSREYGGRVPITMRDVGKSVSDVIKRKEKKYDKYTGDRWNEISRLTMHLPFEMLSSFLGEREDERQYYNAGYSPYRNSFKKGGSISAAKAKKILRDGKVRGKALTAKQKRFFGAIAGGARMKRQDGGPIDSNAARDIRRSGYTEFPTENVSEIADYLGNLEYGPYSHLQFDNPDSGVFKDLSRISAEGDKAGLDRHITDLQMPLSNAPVYYRDILEERATGRRPGTKRLNRQGGGSVYEEPDLTFGDQALGYMPVVGSALNLLRASRREPEQFSYPRISHQDIDPVLTSSDEAVRGTQAAFATQRELSRRDDPRNYMRNAIAGATQESRGIAGIRERDKIRNAQAIQRARSENARGNLYADIRNADISRYEQIDRARDRAALETDKSLQQNQLFTQFGQIGRDRISRKYDTARNEAFFDTLGDLRGLHNLGPQDQEIPYLQAGPTGNLIETAPAMEGAVPLFEEEDPYDKYTFNI
jgi:hypothetical protein